MPNLGASTTVSDALTTALREASTGLVERQALVELIALAAVAGEHLLVVGPPGTAKSEAVRRVATVLGGKYFEYLLGRFTEPSELFGPVDLRKLREGLVETETTGMLPEAEVAFLDEVFLGSTAILNTLLGILNDRRFRRGHTEMTCPLRVCVGATNQLPDDDALQAFADRFLLRYFAEPVADPQLEALLEGGWGLRPLERGPVGLDAIDDLSRQARAANLDRIRPALGQALRLLRKEGIGLSDRRLVKSQRLVAAAAALAGRQDPTEADLWPIIHVVPDAAGQRAARDVLRDLLAAGDNAALPHAAEEATAGPAARARRLTDAALALWASPHAGAPGANDPTSTEDGARWRLKLEGILREIDASFASEELPDDLRRERQRIVEELTFDRDLPGRAPTVS